MRKLMFLLLTTVCMVTISCKNEPGGMSATTKKNMEVNTAITKAYEAGDFSKMGDYIAADAVDHGGEKGDVKGLENIITEMKKYRSQMTDMKTSVVKEMADDEYVFTWANFSGMMDGNKMEMASLDVSKFKDGKAVEHWVFMNPADVMKMMPPMPESKMPAMPMPATDSMKK